MRDCRYRARLVTGFAILSGAFLVSCNDNGSDDGRIESLAVSATDEAPGGVYFGTFTADGAAPISNQVIGIVSENLDAQFPVLLSSQLHYAGQVSVDGTSLTGTLTEYRGAFRRFSGVDGVSSVALDGSVTTADSIVATLTTDSGSAQLDLSYGALYEAGSSLALTAGVWSFGEAFLGGGAYAVTLDIDANGGLFGNDSDGCIFSGAVSIIDDRYNAYRASVRIDNCGDFDGDYSGLAFLSDRDAGRLNALALSVSNDVFAFNSVFNKT